MNLLGAVPEALKQLGAYTAVFYAFGFLAVRARLNALGVWSHVPIFDVTYLVEGALFFTTTVYAVLLPYGLTFLFLSVLVWGGFRVFPSKLSILKALLQRGKGPLQIASLLLVAALVVTFATDALGVVGLLIGEGPQPVPRIAGVSITDPVFRTNAYGAIVAISICAVLLFVWLRNSKRVPRLYLVAAGAIVALTLLLLPLNFAVLLRVQEFPEAEISVNKENPQTVFLVQQAGDQLVVRSKDRTINILPRADVGRIRIKRHVSLEAILKGESNDKKK